MKCCFGFLAVSLENANGLFLRKEKKTGGGGGEFLGRGVEVIPFCNPYIETPQGA